MNRPKFFLTCLLTALISGCAVSPYSRMAVSDEEIPADTLLLHVPSPDWRDQIIYFVMSDRFNDGDPGNNDQGVGAYDPSQEHFYSGGDIQGIIDELDYIEGLGATAVWSTPIILNQWKNPRFNFTGYSGYYGLNFAEVDPHNGTLETYQRLSDQLHRRGMYLIKDIVVNHSAFLFEYEGEYDAADTLSNFRLIEPDGIAQKDNMLSPFDMFDRANREHAQANIYNWTPTISDYQNLGEAQFTHQLGGLADINTKNPVVIDALKSVYGDWISKAGVDAFRIDTVRYVEPSFFDQFMNDENGILAQAKNTGRDNFIAFGEVLDYSQPYENEGEKALATYLGSDDAPILSSVISFPLKQDFKAVFAQGKPTAHLAYRLEQHMRMYRSPYLSPTLIDNHDVERFLASGSLPGFKQALATMFTIPGIPTIYQGTAQAFEESRQAMFEGGYLSLESHFDQTTELYTFISKLAELRKTNRVLSRGTLEITRSSKYGAGLMAYRRGYDGDVIDILINTADTTLILDNYAFNKPVSGPLTVLFSENIDEPLATSEGRLTTILPARSILIAAQDVSGASFETAAADLDRPTLKLEQDGFIDVHTSDIKIQGTSQIKNGEIWVVKNGRADSAIAVPTTANGDWRFTYAVENLGEDAFDLLVYDQINRSASERLSVRTRVDEASVSYCVSDPKSDDHGLSGRYVDLQQASAAGQKDILAVQALSAGDTLKLELKMANVTTDWLPPNGFDNVAFNIFIDLPGSEGVSFLPELNADMPDSLDWDLAHVSYGWGNTAYSSNAATATAAGTRFGATPLIEVDKASDTISFTYKGADYGVRSWEAASIYIATWDIAGEGAYVLLGPEPAEWAFGGGAPGDPKILDEHLIEGLGRHPHEASCFPVSRRGQG